VTRAGSGGRIRPILGPRRGLAAAVLSMAVLLAAAPTAHAESTIAALTDEAFALQAAGDSIGAQAAVDQLPVEHARRTAAVMGDVAQALSFPLTDRVPVGIAPGSVVVVLGFGLLDDGGLRPILVERLEKGLAVAAAYPHMPVVVSGGNPRGGRTEAEAMAAWLIDRGLDPLRIHQESTSVSTATNALQTAELLRIAGLGSGAVLVTSSNHLRRSVADFLTAGITLQAVLAADGAAHGPPSPQELSGIYADARSVAGI
jgi:vancomycin permeability regulator SanA